MRTSAATTSADACAKRICSDMTTTDSQHAPDVALCVDLDGTLLRTDILHESLLVLLRRNPLLVFLLPFWLMRGKAAFKHEIACRVELDVESLPYDSRVLRLLEGGTARPRVLCTASHRKFAEAVSRHLGVFEQVMASDETGNLSGREKATALIERFGERGFDYAGNSPADLHVWRHAREAWVVDAPKSVAAKVERHARVAVSLEGTGNAWTAWSSAIRTHQWLKNLLVFVPLFAAHRFTDTQAYAEAACAFVAFCLCASGVYLLNDLFDLDADRHHARKRQRPFASGQIKLIHGMIAAPALSGLGLLIAMWIAPLFALCLAAYYIMTAMYTIWLKRVAMLDVVLLAGLYTARIIGGAAAMRASLSFWLLAFSMFLFLSLAMVKRYAELADALSSGKKSAKGRGYSVEDLVLIQSLGTSSGYIAVLVLALYINSPESLKLYAHPQAIWLVCPLLLYWVSRTWVIAHRGIMHDDPVVFAATDRVSQLVVLMCGIIVLCAL